MTEMLKVLIVDEDPDSRVDTRKAVQRAQLGVAGEVGYGTSAVSFALEALPDIVLLAVEEPAARPLETAEGLANALPETPFIIYSSVKDREALRRSMVFGARDYILKPVQAARLIEAVNTVLVQEERRHMRRAGQLLAGGGRGSVITVVGAKGGIGKTVISVNLALGLRRDAEKAVVLVDGDTQFGDVATALDLYPSRTVADLLGALGHLDREEIGEYLLEHSSGVRILAAPDGEAWEGYDGEAVKRVVDLLAQTHDFVVIDTGGSLDPLVRACLEVSTLTLVVTSGEVSSIRDTAAALRRLASWGIDSDRLKVVLNQGARVNGFRREDLKAAIGEEIFWEMPYDRRIPVSVQVGQPVMLEGKSAGARNLAALASRIAGAGGSAGQQPRAKSVWKRLVGRE